MVFNGLCFLKAWLEDSVVFEGEVCRPVQLLVVVTIEEILTIAIVLR